MHKLCLLQMTMCNILAIVHLDSVERPVKKRRDADLLTVAFMEIV